jgi:hypothetical protein
VVAVVPPWPRETVTVVPLTASTSISSLSIYRSTLVVCVGAVMPVALATTIWSCLALVTAADRVVGVRMVWPKDAMAAKAASAESVRNFFICRFS